MFLGQRVAVLPVMGAILVSSYVGSHNQTGTPQASLDMDASRLVLLDRLDRDENEPSGDEDIPF